MKHTFSRITAGLMGLAMTGLLCLQSIGTAAAVTNPITYTGSYTAVPQQRLLDTRSTSRIAGDTSRQFCMVGQAGIPAVGVSAVVVNLTAVNPASSGYITAYASDVSRPLASNVNLQAGAITANSTLVQLGADGCIRVYTSATTDLLIDTEGWIGQAGSGASAQVTSISPKRLLDSRLGSSPTSGRALAAQQTVAVPVAGVNDIPKNATAALVNVTGYTPSSSGYLTVYPSGVSRPVVSNVNTVSAPTANFSVVPIGSDGTISVFSATGNTHAIVDVQGYVTAGSPSAQNAGFGSRTPSRVLDTRTSNGGHLGLVNTRETIRLNPSRTGAIPTSGVSSVVMHITAVSQGNSNGYITAYGDGGLSQFVSSALNLPASGVRSNTVTCLLGPDGTIALTNVGTPVHLIVDIQGWTAAPDLSVSPPQAAKLQLPASAATDSKQARQLLASANKYALTTWWNGDAQTLMTNPLTTTTEYSSSDPVRRLSMEAFSLATALSTGAYDPTVTGVDWQTATRRAAQLIEYVSSRHVSNARSGWGGRTQGSLWAGYAGRAAWLIWDQLSPAVQGDVARMIALESDNVIGYSPHYMRNANGTAITPGDTGSDDASWRAMPLQLALVMFPNHPHQSVWRFSAIQFGLAAWARPSDLNDQSTMVNGAPLSAWLNGSNVEQNGIVYNHNRVAPDYMSLIYQTYDETWITALAGQSTPQAARQLTGAVYKAYSAVNFSKGTFNAPGGTIYMPDSAGIYYPQGIDWGTGQMLPFALADAQAKAFLGQSAPDNTADYEALHVRAALAMQSRSSDGRTYTNTTDYIYSGREEHSAQLAALLYMTKYLRDNDLIRYNNNSYWLPRN